LSFLSPQILKKVQHEMHFHRCHKAAGQQPELLYLNHQAAPLLKDNKDIFSNESAAVGGNGVNNNSFLSFL
jgi:hypothetical protein